MKQVASLPGVIDLLAARERRSGGLEVVDDLDEVFTLYYAQHPDQDAFEVFEE